LDNNLVAQEKKKKTIRNLQQQKERTDIALDYINQELQYVFYGDKKMELEQGKGCYILKVNGMSVKPNKISVGERNALALCYFFASLDAGKRETEKYKTESLVVIDDPVSSFDHGNRVGVMSLLRYQFYKIVDGNANSRILVMSHDLHTVFDLVKIRSDIQGGRGGEKKFLELENRQLKEQDVRNEYKKLLEQVYAYAADDREKEYDDVLEMSIGNIMRRMMEAFSSFCYNEPFEKMAREENVLALVPEKKRGYYENLMWRLVLNSESHEEENVYSLDLMVENYTRKEKLKTAKSLLLFLYYINKVHLVAYLKEKNEKVDKIKKIESWMTEEL
jgi:wobble nucleotide-excising tRNase